MLQHLMLIKSIAKIGHLGDIPLPGARYNILVTYHGPPVLRCPSWEKEKPDMTLLKLPRILVFAVIAAIALLLGFFLSATVVAPAVKASGGVTVSNLVIKSITLDPQTKVATAKGALTCTGARRARVVIEATQPVGRVNTAYAYSDKFIGCDGRKRFSLDLTTSEGRLVPGYATVGASSEAWTRHGYDFASFSGVLQVSNAP
jgi:hypothetical protein